MHTYDPEDKFVVEDLGYKFPLPAVHAPPAAVACAVPGLPYFDGVYTQDEAAACVERIQSFGFPVRKAMKSKGILLDEPFSAAMFDVVKTVLADARPGWTPSHVHPHWRYVQGDPGYCMSEHFDACLVTSINCKSYYSLVLYLNDDEVRAHA